MCGKPGEGIKKAKIEGTIMAVCVGCATYGTEVAMPKKVSAKVIRNYAPKEFKNSDEDASIVSNAGNLLKRAREKQGLKQEQLAKKINEKESLIHNIESGKFKPRLETARKLEKFFGINLIQQTSLQEDNTFLQTNNNEEYLTMGDLLKQSFTKK